MVAADQSSCCRVKFEAGAGVGVREGLGKKIVRGRVTRGVVDLKARLGVLLEDILLVPVVHHRSVQQQQQSGSGGGDFNRRQTAATHVTIGAPATVTVVTRRPTANPRNEQRATRLLQA